MSDVQLSPVASRQCRRSFDQLRTEIKKNIATIAEATLETKRGDVFTAGMVMVCAVVQTGPVPLYISRVTGINRRRCAMICARLRKAGVFGAGGVYADPWADGDALGATMNFVLDAMIGADVVAYSGPRGKNRLYSRKP